MKKPSIPVLLAWAFLIFILTTTAWAASGAGGSGPADYVPGEVLVKFRPEAGEQARLRWRVNWNMDLRQHFRSIGVDHFRLSGGMSVAAALDLLRRDPDVVYAEPNYHWQADLEPNDAYFSQLWGLHNTGQPVEGVAGVPGADIDAPGAWDVTTGSGQVLVAVIDSGLDFLHPEFAGRVWENPSEIADNGVDDDGNGYVDDTRGWDFVAGDNLPLPNDARGHGTHVAGTIAAEGGNGTGVAGVSWQARILPLRFLDALGFGPTTDAILAFEYANQAGADIINCSWGGGGYSQALKDVIDASPALVVCAAGNSGADSDAAPHYPAAYTSANLISVAATDSNDEPADFSNYGLTSVDVAAPGVSIYSCLPGRQTLWSDDFDDGDLDGWTDGGPNNDWGLTDEEAASSPWSLADSPGGDYSQRTKSWCRAPEVNLAGQVNTKLVFKVRGSSEPGYDQLYVEASPNGVDWVALPIKVGGIGILYAISGTISDWRDAEVDLSPLDGLSAAYFRFTFISDWSNNYDGWYLDDVAVTAASDQYDGSEYGYLNGTSMAAPHVSGIAALVKAGHPSLDAAGLRAAIEAGVDQLAALDGRIATGGRVNALGALAAVSAFDTVQFSTAGYRVDETVGQAVITVTRTGSGEGAASVDYYSDGGTATPDTDYTPVSGSLTWNDGDIQPKIFTVMVADDAIWEGAQTVGLYLQNPDGVSLGVPAAATLTIDDDDYHPGSIQFAAGSWTIDENEGTAQLTVTRSNGSDGPVSVDYATSDGTATAGSDYTAAGGTLYWADGDSSDQTIAVDILDDEELEPDETLNLILSNPTDGATLGDPYTAVLTIVEDEQLQPGTLQFELDTYAIAEDSGLVVVSVTRTDGSDGIVSVVCRSADGTATAGSDYTAVDEILTWAHGDDAPKSVVVAVSDDSVYEGDETVSLQLESPAGGAKIGDPSSSVLTILENEQPLPGTVQFSAAAYRVNEDEGTAVISVIRSGGSDGAVSVGYATSDGTATAGQDYTATSGTLNWPDGDSGAREFTVPISDDSVYEGDETVGLLLESPGGGVGLGAQASSLLTIHEDEAPPEPQPGTVQFSAAAYSVNENGVTAAITVTRTGGSDGSVSVTCATSDGTARAGEDYSAISQTLSWADGDSDPETLTVAIIDDGDYDGDRTVNLRLSGPTNGATLGDPSSSVLTILENDLALPGTVQFSAAAYSVNESAGTATISVIRSGGSDGAVSVGYRITDGTALAGFDYTATDGTFSWADGQTGTRTFSITIIEDALPEAAETVHLALADLQGGVLMGSPGSAVLTIVNVQSVPPDSDGDGMPDDWETAYGLNPDENDAGDDPDGDGVTNLDEYLAGSHPTNAEPEAPVLISPANGSEGMTLTPVLSIGPFLDPDGDAHAETEWVLSTSADFTDGAAQVMVRKSVACLTICQLPDYLLDLDTRYYWGARFRDDGNAVSPWSPPFSFRTQAEDPDDEDGDGVPDIQELRDAGIDLDLDGTPDIAQADMTCAALAGGHPVCLKADIGSGLFVDALKIIDPEDLEGSRDQPQIRGPGLFAFRITLTGGDDDAEVTLYFSEPIADGARWYKFDSISGWKAYPHAIPGISPDGNAWITLQLKDGDTGFGDSDGIRNQVIIDPGGYGVAAGVSPTSSPADGQGGGGCFINNVRRQGDAR